MGKTNIDNKSGSKTDLAMMDTNMDKIMDSPTKANSFLNEDMSKRFRKDEKSV